MAFETPSGTIKLIMYVSIVCGQRILLVEYVTPPNPDKKGWWIPAPEISFGEDPAARAATVLADLGFADALAELCDIESFTVGGAWHVIFHYRAEVASDAKPVPGAGIRRWQWVSAEDMPDAPAFAHGKWERSLALRRIEEEVRAET